MFIKGVPFNCQGRGFRLNCRSAVALRSALSPHTGQDPMSQASRDTRYARLNSREGVIRVLLVDDVQSVRETLRSILATYPTSRSWVKPVNGEEALESVEVLKPSVVVMDIQPQLDGIKATSLIKRVYPHVVIWGCLVYANDDIRKAMTAAGATTVISKEVAVEQLRDEIIESINKRSASFH